MELWVPFRCQALAHRRPFDGFLSCERAWGRNQMQTRQSPGPGTSRHRTCTQTRRLEREAGKGYGSASALTPYLSGTAGFEPLAQPRLLPQTAVKRHGKRQRSLSTRLFLHAQKWPRVHHILPKIIAGIVLAVGSSSAKRQLAHTCQY